MHLRCSLHPHLAGQTLQQPIIPSGLATLDEKSRYQAPSSGAAGWSSEGGPSCVVAGEMPSGFESSMPTILHPIMTAQAGPRAPVGHICSKNHLMYASQAICSGGASKAPAQGAHVGRQLRMLYQRRIRRRIAEHHLDGVNHLRRLLKILQTFRTVTDISNRVRCPRQGAALLERSSCNGKKHSIGLIVHHRELFEAHTAPSCPD